MPDYYGSGLRARKAKVLAYQYVLPSGQASRISVYPGVITDEHGSLLKSSWPPVAASGPEAQTFLDRMWADLDEIASNPEGLRLLETMGQASPLPSEVPFDHFTNPDDLFSTPAMNVLITHADPGGETVTLKLAGPATGVSLSGSWDGEGAGSSSNFIQIRDDTPGMYTKEGRLFAMRSATVLFHELVHSLRSVLGFGSLDASKSPVRADYPLEVPGTKDALGVPRYEVKTQNAEELITHGGSAGLREVFGEKKAAGIPYGIKADPYAAKSVRIALEAARRSPGDVEIQRTLMARQSVARKPLTELSFVKASPIPQPFRSTYDVPSTLQRVRFALAPGASWNALTPADYNEPTSRNSRLAESRAAAAACSGANPVEACAAPSRAATADEAKAARAFEEADAAGKVVREPADQLIIRNLPADELPVYARAVVEQSALEARAGSGKAPSFTSDLAETWRNPNKVFQPFGASSGAVGEKTGSLSKTLTNGWSLFNHAATPAMVALWIHSVVQAFSTDASDLDKAAATLAVVPVVGQLVGIAQTSVNKDYVGLATNLIVLLASAAELTGQPEAALVLGVAGFVTWVVGGLVNAIQNAIARSALIDMDQIIAKRDTAWHDFMGSAIKNKTIPALLADAQSAFDAAQKQLLWGADVTMASLDTAAQTSGDSAAIEAARAAKARLIAETESAEQALRSGFVNNVHQALDDALKGLNNGTGSDTFTDLYNQKVVLPDWMNYYFPAWSCYWDDHGYWHYDTACHDREIGKFNRSVQPAYPDSASEAAGRKYGRTSREYSKALQAYFWAHVAPRVKSDVPMNKFSADDLQAYRTQVDDRISAGKMFATVPPLDTAPVPPTGFTNCADSPHDTCAGSPAGTGQVAFGAAGSYVTAPLPSAGLACKASSFAVDANPHAHETCFVPATDNKAGGAGGSWLPVVRTCARQGHLCEVSGTQEVAYGAGARWITKPVTGSITCDSRGFGGDPDPGADKNCTVLAGAVPGPVARSAPAGLCAAQDGTCYVSGTTTLAFGTRAAGGSWIYRTFDEAHYPHGVPCTTATFGKDPSHGHPNSCYTARPQARFTYCAGPGGTCTVPNDGIHQVAYGGDGAWVVKTATPGSTECKDTTFEDVSNLQGNTHNYCYLSASGADLVLGDHAYNPQNGGSDWYQAACARDGDTGPCATDGNAELAYGIYNYNSGSGTYYVKQPTRNITHCGYTAFTSRDPYLNVAHCFLLAPPALDYDTTQTTFTYPRPTPGTTTPARASSSKPTTVSSFSSGFEEGDPRAASGDVNHGQSHSGQAADQYMGNYDAAPGRPSSTVVFDLSSHPVAVGTRKTLSYWIFPLGSANSETSIAAVSTCAALDLVFSDGTALRDHGASAGGQCGRLQPDQWNHVTVDLAASNSNKVIQRILFEVQAPASGNYTVVIDDVTIDTEPNNRPSAGASSESPAANGWRIIPGGSFPNHPLGGGATQHAPAPVVPIN
ncbi:hypothetical protein ACH4UM_22475 [Streptomyces sp. NPDC020801]|uniref:hypothetical protein n=1 Tax=unclassified Streptomyces TaxID=2593676 RepID=UPI0037889B2B